MDKMVINAANSKRSVQTDPVIKSSEVSASILREAGTVWAKFSSHLRRDIPCRELVAVEMNHFDSQRFCAEWRDRSLPPIKEEWRLGVPEVIKTLALIQHRRRN